MRCRRTQSYSSWFFGVFKKRIDWNRLHFRNAWVVNLQSLLSSAKEISDDNKMWINFESHSLISILNSVPQAYCNQSSWTESVRSVHSCIFWLNCSVFCIVFCEIYVNTSLGFAESITPCGSDPLCLQLAISTSNSMNILNCIHWLYLSITLKWLLWQSYFKLHRDTYGMLDFFSSPLPLPHPPPKKLQHWL